MLLRRWCFSGGENSEMSPKAAAENQTSHINKKVANLEEELRNVHNNTEEKVKYMVEKQVENHTTHINTKIEEEVMKRLKELETAFTPAAPIDPRKNFKCPECNWRGMNKGVVKSHMKRDHK